MASTPVSGVAEWLVARKNRARRTLMLRAVAAGRGAYLGRLLQPGVQGSRRRSLFRRRVPAGPCGPLSGRSELCLVCRRSGRSAQQLAANESGTRRLLRRRARDRSQGPLTHARTDGLPTACQRSSPSDFFSLVPLSRFSVVRAFMPLPSYSCARAPSSDMQRVHQFRRGQGRPDRLRSQPGHKVGANYDLVVVVASE